MCRRRAISPFLIRRELTYSPRACLYCIGELMERYGSQVRLNSLWT
jgi:hypothetical protein